MISHSCCLQEYRVFDRRNAERNLHGVIAPDLARIGRGSDVPTERQPLAREQEPKQVPDDSLPRDEHERMGRARTALDGLLLQVMNLESGLLWWYGKPALDALFKL